MCDTGFLIELKSWEVPATAIKIVKTPSNYGFFY